MQYGDQIYHSMAEANVTAWSDDAVLPVTLEVTAGVPNWSVSEYFTRHGRTLDALRLARMFPDGQSRAMVDRRGVWHNTNIGVWEQRWSLMRSWCAGTISPAGPFEMTFVHHVDEVSYVRRL